MLSSDIVVRAARVLEKDNDAGYYGNLTTGFLGTPYLCPALSDNDLNEYAYALLLQTRCPSWLYEVEMGDTTVWERWNSKFPLMQLLR